MALKKSQKVVSSERKNHKNGVPGLFFSVSNYVYSVTNFSLRVLALKEYKVSSNIIYYHPDTLL